MSTSTSHDPVSRHILGLRVDNTSYEEASHRILDNARAMAGGYVCIANVHMVMEAYDDSEYRQIVNGATLVTPDGVPLVWALRRMKVPDQTRVYGPDLTLAVLELAEREGVPLGFFGSTEDVLQRLVEAMKSRFPQLKIVYVHSPSFGEVTSEEDEAIVQAINSSGARILMVGLGCPKQERWMAVHESRVAPVMLGVGAAFDFLAGCKPQAPSWMQRAGLEWLFRLATEPRRLWKRYLKHNPRFVLLLMKQLFLSSDVSRGSKRR